MTALIVIAAIILVFAFFLNMKIRAEVKYIGGELDFKVKYLWFTIYPLKEKKPKKPKKKKSVRKTKASSEQESSVQNVNDESGESAADTSGEADSESSAMGNQEMSGEKAKKEKLSEKLDKLKDIIEKVKIIWSVSKKRLKRIFTHIYIDDLMIDFVIAGGDAYETAMNYGRISAVTYNAITAVRLLFPITVKTVDIVCDFDGKKSVYDCEVKITARPATILSAGFGILFGLLFNIKKLLGKSNEQPDEKAAVTA